MLGRNSRGRGWRCHVQDRAVRIHVRFDCRVRACGVGRGCLRHAARRRALVAASVRGPRGGCGCIIAAANALPERCTRAVLVRLRCKFPRRRRPRPWLRCGDARLQLEEPRRHERRALRTAGMISRCSSRDMPPRHHFGAAQ